jgi:chromosome segregation ATPase
MSEDRLDRIEKLVESNAKSILALAEQAKEDRQQIREVAEGSLRTNDAVMSLLSVIERQQSDIGTLNEGIRSTNAAIKRLDRILDQLVSRGDGDSASM